MSDQIDYGKSSTLKKTQPVNLFKKNIFEKQMCLWKLYFLLETFSVTFKTV